VKIRPANTDGNEAVVVVIAAVEVEAGVVAAVVVTGARLLLEEGIPNHDPSPETVDPLRSHPNVNPLPLPNPPALNPRNGILQNLDHHLLIINTAQNRLRGPLRESFRNLRMVGLLRNRGQGLLLIIIIIMLIPVIHPPLVVVRRALVEAQLKIKLWI